MRKNALRQSTRLFAYVKRELPVSALFYAPRNPIRLVSGTSNRLLADATTLWLKGSVLIVSRMK
jgi:hypothetical protein